MYTYRLNDNHKNFLLSVCADIANNVDPSNHEQLVKVARTMISADNHDFHEIMESIRTPMLRNGHYVLILENLPSFEYPDVVSILLGYLLGDVIKEYEGGVWIKDIKFNPRTDEILDSPSSKDKKEFYLHTDLSYTEEPPAYFLFHCIKNPQNQGGMSIFCNLDAALEELSKFSLLELHKKQFYFPAPSYYIKTGYIVNSILTTCDNDTLIRFRRDGIRSQSKEGYYAISEFIQTMERNTEIVEFEENTVLYINNRKYLHGRFGFLTEPKKDMLRYFNQVYLKC